jgi:hypothetical protein
MIPLGLYRTFPVNLNNLKKDSEKKANLLNKEQSPKMKNIKYVVTNPPKQGKLREDDKVFVLAQRDPSSVGGGKHADDGMEEEAQLVMQLSQPKGKNSKLARNGKNNREVGSVGGGLIDTN